MFGTRDVALSPLLATAFIDTAAAREAAGVSGSGSDAVLDRLVLAASQAIEAYCGTILTQRTVTEAMFPEDRLTNLFLMHSPVIALTSLHIDDVAQTVGNYRVMRDLGALRATDGSYITGTKLVAVYTAGYATLSGDLTEACRQFVRALYQQLSADNLVASESVPDVGSVTYKSALDSETGQGGARVPSSVAALIGQYSRNFAL